MWPGKLMVTVRYRQNRSNESGTNVISQMIVACEKFERNAEKNFLIYAVSSGTGNITEYNADNAAPMVIIGKEQIMKQRFRTK